MVKNFTSTKQKLYFRPSLIVTPRIPPPTSEKYSLLEHKDTNEKRRLTPNLATSLVGQFILNIPR